MNPEIALIIAYLMKARLGVDVAVLYDQGRREIVASARDTRANFWDVKTAVVNLLYEQGARARGLQILSTGAPTPMCLGTCEIVGVDGVRILRDRKLVLIPSGNKPDLTRNLQPSYRETKSSTLPPEGTWALEALRRDLSQRSDIDAVVGTCPKPEYLALVERLAATRYAVMSYLEPSPPIPRAKVGIPGTGQVDAVWMTAAKRLAALVHLHANRGHGDRHGHNIGAILVHPDGRVLAWGVNTNAGNPTRHAETKCIRMFQRKYPNRALPAGSTLYTTLQSCFMCAGTIAHAANGNNVRVLFLDRDKVDDPGSVLKVDEKAEVKGAHERQLRLGHGHHLLAAARWERLSHTLRRGPPDGMDRARFLNLIAPPESKSDGDLRKMQPRRKQLDEMLSSENVRNEVSRELNAGKAALRTRLESQGKLSEMKAETKKEAERIEGVIAARNVLLDQERKERIKVEERYMRGWGGAPIMLQLPRVISRMETPFDGLLRDTALMRGVSLDEKIVLCDTSLYALELLTQVLTIIDGYGEL